MNTFQIVYESLALPLKELKKPLNDFLNVLLYMAPKNDTMQYGYCHPANSNSLKLFNSAHSLGS